MIGFLLSDIKIASENIAYLACNIEALEVNDGPA
ncbi:hypothetical protein BCh11DRAFT_03306 [Burkholderia sp. Ch1-1]|nr:hypothetical protein BCh11DRAFT_03306 [Burkholderia sp. Ch1-1]